MLKKLTDNKLEKLVNKFSSYLFDNCGDKIDKVYLYGSYARGDSEDESDIDICIVINDNKEKIRNYKEVIGEVQCDLGLEYGILISLVFRTKEEFDARKDYIPFYQNILKEGIEIYHQNGITRDTEIKSML